VQRIIKKPSSTCFMEIVPGKYTGSHWSRGSLIVEEHDFIWAEKTLHACVANYDHYEFNELNKKESKNVVDEWRRIVTKMSLEPIEALHDDFFWLERQVFSLSKELSEEKVKIQKMLEELADGVEVFLNSRGCFSVLGI
jgi:hypothetical protein